jgi:hypothetical protein
MSGPSEEEHERWIDPLGGRIRRHVERLVDVDTALEIASEVDAMSNRERPESAQRHDDPHVSRPAPPRTSLGTEETH